MQLSTTQFDWHAVSDRLSGVRDDDVRSDALLIARDIWERRAKRGKHCMLATLCWRSVQVARRRAARNRRIDVCSAAVEQAPQRVETTATDRERVRNRIESLTGRKRDVAELLAAGLSPADVADRLDVSRPRVSQLIAALADTL